MKSRICPYKGHCHSYGYCEDCDYGIAYEKLGKKVKNLKAKNQKLLEENKRLKEKLYIITHPNF